MGQVLLGYEIFSARGRAGVTAPPSVNLGPLVSRKLLEQESSNSTHIYIGPGTLFRYEHVSAKGVLGAQRP